MKPAAKENSAPKLLPEIDQAILDQKLSNLHSQDTTNATVNMWVTKTLPHNKNKRFSEIKRLKLDTESKNKFKSYVTDYISGHAHIVELRSIYTVQDNRFFYVESSSTDLDQAIKTINEEEIDSVKNEKELNEYNSYIIQLTYGNPEQNIYAYRYISSAWAARKTSGKFFSFDTHDNELIVKIEETQKFEITPYLDFLQFNNDVFIGEIRQFEVAMNYHARLIEKKEEALTAFCTAPSFSENEKEKLKQVIGVDKHLMRQLAAAHEKGYYENEAWLTRLRAAAQEAGNWRIRFSDDGKIEVDTDKLYVKELLTLLQNKRVRTIVDGMIFDVDGELIAII